MATYVARVSTTTPARIGGILSPLKMPPASIRPGMFRGACDGSMLKLLRPKKSAVLHSHLFRPLPIRPHFAALRQYRYRKTRDDGPERRRDAGEAERRSR